MKYWITVPFFSVAKLNGCIIISEIVIEYRSNWKRIDGKHGEQAAVVG